MERILVENNFQSETEERPNDVELFKIEDPELLADNKTSTIIVFALSVCVSDDVDDEFALLLSASRILKNLKFNKNLQKSDTLTSDSNLGVIKIPKLWHFGTN